MKNNVPIIIIILLFVVGCTTPSNRITKAEDSVKFPLCYAINGNDDTIRLIAVGDALSNPPEVDYTCSEETVFAHNKREMESGYVDVGVLPVKDVSIEAFVLLGEYRRGAFAVVWQDSQAERHCYCYDLTHRQGTSNLVKGCEFIQEYLSNNSIFDICRS